MQKTAADRFRRTLKRIADWCRQHRHEPVRDQWLALKRKLAGHFAYFGVTGNCNALISLRFRVIAVWWKWLGRRSQRTLSWEKMLRLLARYPLPEPRIRPANVAYETVDRRAGCGKPARPAPWELRLESSWNPVAWNGDPGKA